MPKYTVHATVTKSAEFTVIADDAEQAIQKVNEGEWLEEVQDQVISIDPNHAEEDTA